MTTRSNGGRSALLVVDVQVGVMSQLWDSTRTIGTVSQAVERARLQGIPIVWILHTAEHLPKGSDEWQLVPKLVPAEGEPILDKVYNSAFAETELQSELERLGITHILLCGAATNWCIRATAYGALDRGYDLTLISDAHTTADMEDEGGSSIPAKGIIEELNIVMEWVSYPDCRSTAAPLDKVDALNSEAPG